MLTAPWGTGKSYYLQNKLIPFIKDESGKKCIVISLYPIKEVSEICKSILIEVKLNKLKKIKPRWFPTGQLIAKSLFHGVSTHYGIDFGLSEKDYAKLFKSLDLSNTILFFEDVERSKLPPLELLGFVNNLSELDGVKVILIANEDEIPHDGDTDEEHYARIKEKTIYETLSFDITNAEVIGSILKTYSSTCLAPVLESNPRLCEEILAIMKDPTIHSYNLRSLKYALQKSEDLFKNFKGPMDSEYLKCTFLSIVAFVLRKKADDNIHWSSDSKSPADLGTAKYPLPQYCYDYIVYSNYNSESARTSHDAYLQQRDYEQTVSEVNSHLKTIYSYWIVSEKSLVESIRYMLDFLKSSEEFPYSECVRLANYLIGIKHCDICPKEIDLCKDELTRRLKCFEQIPQPYCYSGLELTDPDALQEWKSFNKSVKEVAVAINDPFYAFDYTVQSISHLRHNIEEQHPMNLHRFVKSLDVNKFVNLLQACSSKDIEELRDIFNSVYGVGDIRPYFVEDQKNLQTLREELVELQEWEEFDKIQKLQISFFIDDLCRYLESLGGSTEIDYSNSN
ncbi:hypothetical protein [Methanomethylophilus alvi]|uniref:hypothetical protein n=1 Tax=Methanomethylophilus alvi TaxID=1291540 RepID=UPI0037DD5D36